MQKTTEKEKEAIVKDYLWDKLLNERPKLEIDIRESIKNTTVKIGGIPVPVMDIRLDINHDMMTKVQITFLVPPSNEGVLHLDGTLVINRLQYNERH